MLSEEELKGVPVLVFANKQVRSFPSTLLGLDGSPSIRGRNATLLRFLAAYPSFLSRADFPPFPSSLVRSFSSLRMSLELFHQERSQIDWVWLGKRSHGNGVCEGVVR